MIPHKDHRGLIVVIRKLDGSPLDVGVSGTTQNQLKGSFNVPSIQSANEIGSNLQHFFCMKETDHDILCSTYKEGLLLEEGNDIYQQIDKVITQYFSKKYSLVSLEKVIPFDEMSSGRYYKFVRQFGGDASPEVDSSFQTIGEIKGLLISYKMTSAREYTLYPPISVGFFQSSSHVIKIQQFLLI
jgi:hypothetical protein